ncbi:hypothetical protein Pfo_020563 [Paulownia fortunei]|nr:hypothetical protein Pfo_020563 [Paulownia fortunei]
MVIGDGILTQLPAGYRFLPTDEELMKFYLTNKVFDRPVPGQVVKDIDANELYSNPPHAIVKSTAGDTLREREWYFFIHHNKNHKKEQEQEKENIQMGGNRIDFFASLGKEDLQKEQEKGNGMGGSGMGFWTSLGKEDFQKGFGFWTSSGKKEGSQEKGKTRMVGNGIGEEDFQKEEEKEKIRMVGNGIGFWRTIGKEDPIYDTNGKVFAFKIHFIYFKGSRDGGKRTHWRMEEYHLVTPDRRGDQKGRSFDGCRRTDHQHSHPTNWTITQGAHTTLPSSSPPPSLISSTYHLAPYPSQPRPVAILLLLTPNLRPTQDSFALSLALPNPSPGTNPLIPRHLAHPQLNHQTPKP